MHIDRILNYLRECETFYLATADNDGPHLRPFGAVCKFEDKIYIGTGNYKPVFKQMINDPRISIVAYRGDNDWMRITAKAVLDRRTKAREAMISAKPVFKELYDIDDEFEVLYLTGVKAEFYTDGLTEEIEF